MSQIKFGDDAHFKASLLPVDEYFSAEYRIPEGSKIDSFPFFLGSGKGRIYKFRDDNFI
jgi:hypothetical protein